MRDIRSLDLNLLKTLDALLEERNVTRAAARLGLTQPAVSAMLARLREAFEDPLFVRAQRGIVPTLRATAMAGAVKQVLGDIEGLLRPGAFDPATATFTLTLAATDYALQVIAVPYLSALRRQAPGIRVAVRPMDERPALALFEQGALDLALMTPASAPPDLHARRLFDETYVCAMREGHPAAAAPELSLDAFCALDHALVSYTGDRFRGVTDEALERLGRQRRVVLSVTSFLVLADVLRASDLVAVAPRRLVAGLGGLALREPPLPVAPFTKLAVWHERCHRDAGHQWARAILFETVGEN
ncbi:MAG TPA: LysR family transcriptional regulator [Novosphingobium sp.]|nr:LysR family transcriptional regulator [Novosphingobium sp.]HZV08806.1 LysR family transcriptional regulator [Novosphingobium sp.]